MNNKILLLGLMVLFAGFVEAGLFDFTSVEPPFFGCSITGCTMQGNIDMNNYVIYNASLVNPSLVEYDPVFTAENSTLWNAIHSKLNITDQRYNDTLLIGIINTSIYVDLNDEINGRISNDSYLQGQINYLELNKLNITDQRYNDTQYILDALNNYYNKTESDTIYYPLTNPAGYINESYANNSYYPLNSNPAGYVNNDTLINLTNGTWVKVTGDTMTGDLNMSNHSILDVDLLSVHNITGRSPVYINSPVISFQNITATNFYGNINGQNGTIFGMTIQNGTITNMHVSDSAIFNTSLLPEMNNTWSIGKGPDKFWKSFYVVDLVAANITSPDITYLINITNQILVDLDYKLNITDQRYNDTLLIFDVNNTLYALIGNETQARISDDSYLQGQINYLDLYKLNISDQRYNDTALIYSINGTLYMELDNKLNISDQRYNDTVFVLNELLNYYNKTEVDDLFSNFTINETDPIFIAENTTIWGTIDSKLNITDQRYNDTILIYAINTSIYIELDGRLNITDQRYNDTAYINNLILNYYNKSEVEGLLDNKLNITDQRYNDTTLIYAVNTSVWNELNNKLNITDQRYNDTWLIEIVNATIKQPTGPYLSYDNTTFWIKETYLNNTINNISKIRKITYNMTCTATSGICSTISGINITHLITEVKVTPTTLSNNYKFLLTEYPNTALVIDQDRATHVGIWDIEKNYAINGQVQANITNANIDEVFTISVIYLTNGVE